MKSPDLTKLKTLVRQLSKEFKPCKTFVYGCALCEDAMTVKVFKSMIEDWYMPDEKIAILKASVTKIKWSKWKKK